MATSWRDHDDPWDMIDAARDEVDNAAFWRFVFACEPHLKKARASAGVLHAIDVAANCLEGRASKDDLNNAWFNAFAEGGYPEDGADAAETVLDEAAPLLGVETLRDLLRRTLERG